MNLSVNERENLRKLFKKCYVKIHNMKNSDIVNNFVNIGYARRTVYKIASANPIKDEKRIGRPPIERNKMKRLVRITEKGSVNHVVY